ncbi:VIR protein [Plasmodium vivax]|uniref:VIR protein n=1 Tax=Plasmodium vivax TaxID=5855 RepID=A0A1G4EFC7_PLAVI|nr:VIR protein [Plasmodium vivax]
MGCNPTIKDDSYKFFDNIENYIKKVDDAQQNRVTTEITSKCKGIYYTMSSSFENELIATSVCEEIVKLYKSLDKIKGKSKCSKDNNNDCEFFNYWVNFQISKSRFNESNCIYHIYDAIESQFTGTDHYDVNIELIYDIKKDELDKMNILYRLYKIYTDLDNILDNKTKDTKELLLSYSTACCTDYLEANYLCSGGNDDNNSNIQFCTQLENFKTKYIGLYERVDRNGPEYTNNFKRLTQCDNNTVSTALIGTTVGLVPLLVGLYKFTPLRQLINSNKGKLTQEYRNNDDERRNIMLMDQGSEHISSQQGTYNIKYHSV